MFENKIKKRKKNFYNIPPLKNPQLRVYIFEIISKILIFKQLNTNVKKCIFLLS